MARHKNGHGIHSPFLYGFLIATVFQKSSKIVNKNYYAGYKDITSRSIKIGSAISRIIRYSDPNIITEINQSDNVFSEFFSPQNIVNKRMTKKYKLNHFCSIDDIPLSDIIYYNLSEYKLLEIPFENVLQRLNNNGIILLSNIHLYKYNERIWESIISSENIKQSIDLFDFGIAFTNSAHHKENFIIRY